jgi:hypothetical protein
MRLCVPPSAPDPGLLRSMNHLTKGVYSLCIISVHTKSNRDKSGPTPHPMYVYSLNISSFDM